MNKKILIVSGYFYPDITPRAFRTTELVKQFSKLGYSITLYIPYRNFDYSQFISEYNIDINYYTNSKPNLDLPKGNNIIFKIYRAFIYLIMRLTEYPYIKYIYKIPNKLNNEIGHDLLISIAAPHSLHWGCNIAIRNNPNLAKIWIADCGDPFMGDSVSKKPSYFKYFEKSFCKRADYISIPLDSAKKAYYREFYHKLQVIPQGFDFEIVNKFITEPQNDILTFAYAGTLYPGYRDLNTLITYLSEKDIEFRFILYTQPSGLVDKYKLSLGKKLVVKNLLPRELLLKELCSMDFLVNIENKTNIQSPSKLIDYGLTKRPIMSINNNLDKSLVDLFLSKNYEKQTTVSNLESYDIKVVADKFIRLM